MSRALCGSYGIKLKWRQGEGVIFANMFASAEVLCKKKWADDSTS